MDQRRVLDTQITQICAECAEAGVGAALEPISGFLTRARAYVIAAAANDSTLGPIGDTEFASVAAVRALLATADDARSALLGDFFERVGLYLPSPAARAVVVNPVLQRITEQYSALSEFAREHYADTDVAAMAIPSTAALAAQVGLAAGV